MKKWFDVEVTRVVVNGKGESVRRNVQHAVVWGTEQTALGLGFRRCPDPFQEDDRRRVTYAEVTELRENFDLQGRKMEAVTEEIEDSTKFGLSLEDRIKMGAAVEADLEDIDALA